MQNVTVDWLQSIEALKEVPGDQLQWLIENSRHYTLAEGEYLFQAGNPAIGTHILIAGRIKLYLQQKEGIREVNTMGPKDISGYLPFSRGYKANVNAKAIADSEVMTLPIEKFREMISHHFELTKALVHIMTTRERDLT